MGTLATIMPVLGLMAGQILGWLAKTEIKPGKKYFRILQHALLAIIIGALFWNVKTIAIISAIVLFIVLKITEFKHPIGLTALLAIPVIINPITQIPVFLYYIPTGTLNTKSKTIAAGIVYLIIIAGYHLFF
ncbi:hypothetical protein KY319_00470 [Candidatus Woesearchaeota archaeon]|nr:hypothetical protein [Candidatus Woesearchaeota archaeon]